MKSKYSQILQLKQLLDSGILSQDEFEKEKENLLKEEAQDCLQQEPLPLIDNHQDKTPLQKIITKGQKPPYKSNSSDNFLWYGIILIFIFLSLLFGKEATIEMFKNLFFN